MGEKTSHILLVEDEESHVELIRRAFESHARRVNLTVARTLREARARLAESAPDLAIIDLVLPDGRGTELLPSERNESLYPIVIMTGHGDEQIAVEAMKAGALDYVVKSRARLADMPHIAERALREWHHIVVRKQAEEALQKSEEYLRTLIENAMDVITVLDEDGIIQDASASCECVLGYRPEDLLGRNAFDFVHADDRQDSVQKLALAFAEPGTPQSMEYRSRHKDGTYRVLESIGRTLGFQTEGSEPSFLTVARDITERKRAENRLREALAEVERLRARVEAEKAYLQEELKNEYDLKEVLGSSAAMQQMMTAVRSVARTDTTVLVHGETGVGKELVVRALHELSGRRDRALIKVNCAAVAAGLVESELFGHERGAFTGALGMRKGRFELADGGSIFLDEIGELSLEVQAKLLRVLEEREFERVGSSTVIRTDARVFAATNRELETEVAEGRFRQDLYYRVNVFPIRVPPLRERNSDVIELAEHFLRRFSLKLGRRFVGFSPETVEKMIQHDWPGNVRELRNFVERTAITSRTPYVEDLDGFLTRSNAAARPETLQDVQKFHILRVLGATGWVIEGEQGAARILGINPSTLRSRIRKLGIEKPSRPLPRA